MNDVDPMQVLKRVCRLQKLRGQGVSRSSFRGRESVQPIGVSCLDIPSQIRNLLEPYHPSNCEHPRLPTKAKPCRAHHRTRLPRSREMGGCARVLNLARSKIHGRTTFVVIGEWILDFHCPPREHTFLKPGFLRFSFIWKTSNLFKATLLPLYLPQYTSAYPPAP